MNLFTLVLFLLSIFCIMRAALLLLSLRQKRAYPPALLLKQRALFYGCLGTLILLCMLLICLFV